MVSFCYLLNSDLRFFGSEAGVFLLTDASRSRSFWNARPCTGQDKF